MLKRILDFFKRILPGGKRRTKGIAVESVMAQLIAGNLQAVTGETHAVEVSIIRFDEFEEILDGLFAHPEASAGKAAGYILHAFSGAEYAPISFFFPPDCIESFRNKLVAPAAPSEPITGLAGNLPQLFFIQTSQPSPDAERGPGFETIRPLQAIQVLPPGGSGGLRWRASGCTLYRVLAGETAFFIMTDADKDAELRTGLSENGQFISFVQNGILSGEDPPQSENALSPPSALNISRPDDFMLGRLFLPPRAFHGEHVVRSFFKEVSVTRKAPDSTEETGTWLKLDISSGGDPVILYYFFPARVSAVVDPMEHKKKFGVLISGAVSLIIRTLNLKPLKISPEVTTAPSFPKNAALLVLAADLLMPEGALPCRIYIQNSVLALLLKNLLYPAEMDLLRSGAAQILRAAFFLNESLIRKYTDSFFKTALSNASASKLLKDPALRPLLFHEFAAGIKDRDLRIVVQNHLIRELEPLSLSSLFYYYESGVSSADPGEPRLIRFADFDESRFKGVLPEAIREEWDRNSALGSRTHCDDEASFLELNINTMNGIHKAVREGRLLLSARALYLLRNGFYRVMQKRFDAKLREAHEKNIPFAALRTLPRKALQALLMHTDNRVLCLSLLGLEGEMEFLSRNISRRRIGHLRSDFEYYGGLYSKNLIDSEEVLAIKEAVQRAALGLLESQKK